MMDAAPVNARWQADMAAPHRPLHGPGDRASIAASRRSSALTDTPLRMVAVDLGAESGRAVVGTFDGGRLALEDVHRFPNVPGHRWRARSTGTSCACSAT